jgi:hypothetical protein
MEKFYQNVASIFEILFGSTANIMDFLFFISDNYKEYEVDCLALISMRTTFVPDKNWYSIAHSYVFTQIPYALITDYISNYSTHSKTI